MSFSGFSEDDIRKLTKAQNVNKSQKGLGPNKNLKKVTFKPNAVTNASRSKTVLNNNTTNNVRVQELPENARLSAPSKTDNPAKAEKAEESISVIVPNKSDNSVNVEKNAENSRLGQGHKVEKIKEEQSEKPESEKSDRKFKDLDEFEARQKLIEEQNRKRKELLAKALADRTKRTQEEAQKLGEIQEEFRKLDAMLSSDVKILRKQIELASIDYMECQKRYRKIEKEFLDAKVLLHQKEEKKEMLTEHLCTIIEKNEERKAEKLNELLNKLQLISPENHIKQEDIVIEQNEVKN
jgi:RAB6-interacting golgin